jgi:hypothetical protein
MTRTFLDYGRFLDDWLTTINRMTRQLGITWPCNVLKANNDIDAFLQRRQRHHVEASNNLDARDDVPEWVKRICRILPRLEAEPTDADAMREFDRVRGELSKADATFSPVMRSYRDADSELKKARESLEAELSEQKIKLTGLQESLDKKTADADRLESDLAATSAQLDAASAQLDAASAQLDATKADFDEVTRKADRMDEKQRELRQIIAYLATMNRAKTSGDGGGTAADPEPESTDAASRRMPRYVSSSSGIPQYLVRRLGWAKTEEQLQLRRRRKYLVDSGLFDLVSYNKTNPDVVQHGLDPVQHYIRYGAGEGRRPNPLFDTLYYAQQLSPAESIDLDPLLHFIECGAANRLNPHPLFDVTYYLENNPDVAPSGINPLLHYLRLGWTERRNPSIYFDSVYYETQLSVPLKEAGIISRIAKTFPMPASIRWFTM